MRKTSIEVKTIYNIRFDFHDFGKIFAKAKNDPTRLQAFEGFDLDDTTMGNLRDCYKTLGVLLGGRQKTEDLKYIARCLGFDGVENFGGFYSRDEEEYCMTVYNRGADI